MANIFISGASGFIGSHLADRISKTNEVVTIFRDTPNFNCAWGAWIFNVLQKINFIHGDLLDFNVVKRALSDYNVEAVYHVAAQAIVAAAQKDPTETYQTNIQGTVNLLEACRQLDIENFYLVSTDKVYSDKTNTKETDPLVASGIYETSKACQDLTAQAYAKLYGLKVVIGRACNTYGFDKAKRIIPNTINQCLRKEQPIIYENEEAFRQYIYVEDHVSAMLHLTNNIHHPLYPAIYNIGTGDILTQAQVVTKIAEHFGLTPKIVKREKPLKELQSQSLNYDKLLETGWYSKHNFSSGITVTIRNFEVYTNEWKSRN
jgi:CDP-glucose 4,6-dehydratase